MIVLESMEMRLCKCGHLMGSHDHVMIVKNWLPCGVRGCGCCRYEEVEAFRLSDEIENCVCGHVEYDRGWWVMI